MIQQVAVKSWGNSQGIRNPKNILDKLNIGVSDVLQIGVESICDFDWGEPVGKVVI